MSCSLWLLKHFTAGLDKGAELAVYQRKFTQRTSFHLHLEGPSLPDWKIRLRTMTVVRRIAHYVVPSARKQLKTRSSIANIFYT